MGERSKGCVSGREPHPVPLGGKAKGLGSQK